MASAKEQAARSSSLDSDEFGYYLDVQTARLQSLANQGVSVKRGEDHVSITIPGTLSFASNSSQLTPQVTGWLDELALVLKEYDETVVEISGHSDSEGDPGYNRALSERRADAVANYLKSRSVQGSRLVARGFGASRPLADNATEEGRAINRRIELVLWPQLSRRSS